MGVIVWQQSRIVVTYQLKFVVQKITNIIINMKASLTLVLSVIAAVAVADHPVAPYQPAPYHAPAPAPYHAPAPAPYHAPEPYHEEPVKNYEFGYDVHDYDAYGNPNVHSRHEVRDGYDVKGQYKVELPDCRTQIVDYYVDKYKQYHADVKYVGEICPDKSLAHKPAPAPYHAPAPAPAPYHAP